MRLWIVAFVLAATSAAVAQPAPPAQSAPPMEMVLMPRALVDDARTFVRNPQINGAVDLWLLLTACENDNPHNGTMVRMGPDQCPAVTQALAARAAQDAKAAKPPPAKH